MTKNLANRELMKIAESANPYFAVKLAGLGLRQWQAAGLLGVSQDALLKKLSKPLGIDAQREMVERLEAGIKNGGVAVCDGSRV